MRYTLRQIEYFIATAETGSITRASERLNISPPSISAAITHLEQELQTELFIRHHAKGLSLTSAGRTVLTEAKRLRDQANNLYSVVAEASGRVRGQLSLGCMVTLASMIMPELCHSFTSAYPQSKIIQTVADHEALLAMLQRAELDVAVSYNLLVPDGINFFPLAQLPPHVLVGERHPLANHSSVSLQELSGLPLILLDLPLSREYFLSLFHQQGVEPMIATRSPHQDVIRTMVANGYGYTLANIRPRSQFAMDGRPVIHVPLIGDHIPMVIGVLSLKSGRRSRLVEAFEQHCTSFVSDGYIPGMVAPMMGRRRLPP